MSSASITKVAAVICSLLAISSVIWLVIEIGLAPGSREPSRYRGKTASQWISQLNNSSDIRARVEAIQALGSMPEEASLSLPELEATRAGGFEVDRAVHAILSKEPWRSLQKEERWAQDSWWGGDWSRIARNCFLVLGILAGLVMLGNNSFDGLPPACAIFLGCVVSYVGFVAFCGFRGFLEMVVLVLVAPVVGGVICLARKSRGVALILVFVGVVVGIAGLGGWGWEWEQGAVRVHLMCIIVGGALILFAFPAAVMD